LGRPDSATELDEADVGRIFREQFGRSVAALVRAFGDIDVAEDAVHEAFAVALARWPRDGLPPNPGGWITTPRAIAASIGCAASRAGESCSARWLCFRAVPTIPAYPGRTDPCTTTGFG
jgi:hypothetical protein